MTKIEYMSQALDKVLEALDEGNLERVLNELKCINATVKGSFDEK